MKETSLRRAAMAAAIIGACALFAWSAALAGTTSTTTPGPWAFYVGTKKVGEYPALAGCEAAASAHAEGAKRSRTYRCVTTASVAVAYKANPSAQWVLSDWSPWATTMTGSCVAGQQLVRQVRTRSVVTAGNPPEPELSQSRDVLEACHDMPGMGEKPIPAGPQPGYSTKRIRPASVPAVPAPDGVGAFRIVCNYSHMAFDDPIVFPGQPGKSHLHTFWGNAGTTATSTPQSLRTSGDGSCTGGIANRSAYWAPAMVDTATNKAIVPSSIMNYYKAGYNSIPPAGIAVIPTGLSMIAGNPMTQAGPRASWDVHHKFDCGAYIPDQQSIPVCTGGQTLSMHLEFPNCWDGVNLDSADHRSHMAYSGGGSCPATHPVAIPVLTLNIGYEVPAGSDTSKWRLASDAYDHSLPGGYTAHGDVIFAWDEQVIATFTEHCVRAQVDCHAYLLGDGTEVY